MFSARAFVVLWAVLTAAVVGYAMLDLWLSPSLWSEQHFSMQPDFSQIWEVRHWGGRLLRERAWGLLLPNAVVLGGLAALGAHGIARAVARRRGSRDTQPGSLSRDSLVPPSLPSVPPGA